MDDVQAIKERNTRVEADKAWEISWARRILIAVGTYIIIGAYLTYLHVEQAWLHAVVPAVAYMISTLGLGFVKNIWIEKCYKKEVSS